MQTFIFGLTVTVIGMLTVFFGLVVLIMLIKMMQAATSGLGQKKATAPKAEPKAAPAAPAAQADPQVMAAIAAAVAAQDEELIAVISAAVAVMMGEGNGFTVRRIRRVSNAPAWQKAGREEQVYSRF